MTSDQAIGRLLELTGAKPDDTEQLIVVLPRPSNEEAMAKLTAALKEIWNLDPQATMTTVQHDGDAYIATAVQRDNV